MAWIFTAIGENRQGREVPQSLRVWKTQSIHHESTKMRKHEKKHEKFRVLVVFKNVLP
jgi:hypothetical protein